MSPQGRGGRDYVAELQTSAGKEAHEACMFYRRSSGEGERKNLFVAWKEGCSCSRGRCGRECEVMTEKGEVNQGWVSPDVKWLRQRSGSVMVWLFPHQMTWLQAVLEIPPLINGLWAEQHYHESKTEQGDMNFDNPADPWLASVSSPWKGLIAEQTSLHSCLFIFPNLK